jgi:branched-subunit amino acid ABC-type transport system permease component
LVTVLIGLAYGLLSFLVVEYVVRDSSPLNQTIALLGILVGTIAIMAIFDINGRQAAPPLVEGPAVKIGSIFVSRHEVASFIIGLMMAFGLQALLTRTRMGTAMRAMAESRQGSLYCGISLPLVSLSLWLLTGALVSIGGVLLSPLVSPTGPNLVSVLVIALGAATFGGLVKFPQAFVGGIVLGVVTSLSARYVPVLGLRDALPAILVLPLMALAPNGIGFEGLRRIGTLLGAGSWAGGR